MNPVSWMLIAAVKGYQWVLSPLKTAIFGPGARCRFHPSCSAYTVEAIQRHGAARGSWLSLRRLVRCHPWGDSGLDPVPPPTDSPGTRPIRGEVVSHQRTLNPYPHPALPGSCRHR